MATQTVFNPPGSVAAVSDGVVINPRFQQNSDGAAAPMGLGRMADALVSEVRGKYGTMGHRGAVYMAGASTAAIAVPINTTTAGSTFCLVNPAGSGVLMECIRFTLGFLAAGPATANMLGWSLVPPTNAQSAITKIADPVTAGGHPVYLGGGVTNQGYVASAITFASALTVAANWGYQMFSFPATYLTTAAVQFVPMVYNFDGDLLVPPGWCATLTASTAWAANTLVPQISWLEHLL